MNSDQLTDAELGAALRDAANKTVFSPRGLLTFATSAAENYKRTALPSQCFTSTKEGVFEYHAKLVSEYAFDEETAASLPEWAAPLIGIGFKIEKWQWDDGVAVLRFVNSQGLVLGGKTL
jgi:hypothetical protein